MSDTPTGGQGRGPERVRALATRPRLLLRDEPTVGMNPAGTLELRDPVPALRQAALTVVPIEHKLDVVLDVPDRIVVLDHGVKIAEGPLGAVREDPGVREAYPGRRRGA